MILEFIVAFFLIVVLPPVLVLGAAYIALTIALRNCKSQPRTTEYPSIVTIIPVTGFVVAFLAASTVQAHNYGRSYCKSCYPPAVVERVIERPVTQIGTYNDFETPAPYAQQYPVTDAAYVAAQAEQISYQLQAVNDQVASLRQQSQQRQFVMVIPQMVQVAGVQAEVTEQCTTGMQQPAEQPKFSQTQKPGLIQTCVSCHGEGKKAQKHFDMSGPLDCDQQKAALLAVVSGEMPKGKRIQLTPELLGEFSGELGAWKRDQPAQQQTPPQDQTEPDSQAPTEAPPQQLNRIQLPPTPQVSAARFKPSR